MTEPKPEEIVEEIYCGCPSCEAGTPFKLFTYGKPTHLLHTAEVYVPSSSEFSFGTTTEVLIPQFATHVFSILEAQAALIAKQGQRLAELEAYFLACRHPEARPELTKPEP